MKADQLGYFVEVRPPVPSSRCAFDGCQAGGVILPPPAPRVTPPTTAANQIGPRRWYHPGCWDAELRLAEVAVDQLYDRIVAVGDDFRASAAGVRP